MTDDSQGDALFEEDEQQPEKFMFMGHMNWTRPPKWMSFPCPGNTGVKRCMVPLAPQANSNGASWTWDGNREAPTLAPSINCYGCWHGFIRNGEISPDVDKR